MSYIQIEIGGKLRGFKFNRMAQLIFSEKAEPGNLIACLYALVYAGLKACSYAKDEPMDYTFENVCDWTDDLPESEVTKINDAFRETELYKNGEQYIAEQEAAKKKETIAQPLPDTKAIA